MYCIAAIFAVVGVVLIAKGWSLGQDSEAYDAYILLIGGACAVVIATLVASVRWWIG